MTTSSPRRREQRGREHQETSSVGDLEVTGSCQSSPALGDQRTDNGEGLDRLAPEDVVENSGLVVVHLSMTEM